jgi:hypothetical protein
MAPVRNVKGHALIDGNFMNIYRPMRLGDFLANKNFQEVNNVDRLRIRGKENSGDHQSKYFFMNYSPACLWRSVLHTPGWVQLGAMTNHKFLTFLQKSRYVHRRAACNSRIRDPKHTWHSRMRIRLHYRFFVNLDMELQLASEIDQHREIPVKGSCQHMEWSIKRKERSRSTPCQTTEPQQQGVSHFQ